MEDSDKLCQARGIVNLAISRSGNEDVQSALWAAVELIQQVEDKLEGNANFGEVVSLHREV